VQHKLVSIIICNYNYGKYLRQAIDSALAQTYPAIEVVVVDDGSTDDSREIILSYGDRVVPVFKRNAGQISAMNAGFSSCTGETISFLDADDVLLLHRVERAVAVLDTYPRVGWVRSKVKHVDEKLRPMGLEGPRGRSHLVPPDAYAYLERHPTVANSFPVMRRTVASRIFPVPELPAKVDGDSVLDALHGDAVLNVLVGTLEEPVHGYFLDEVLYCYRRHASQEFSGYADAKGLLEEQVRVGRITSSIWSQRMGVRRQGTHVYKHSLLVSVVKGQPLWGLKRWHDFARGLGEGVTLVPRSPRLALRQTAGVIAAFLTPKIWLRRWNPGGGRRDYSVAFQAVKSSLLKRDQESQL
jgi:glycosyltransferase involved in cell wall biosynthesis